MAGTTKTSRTKAPDMDALLALMRKHKVLAFELDGLKVSFSPLALMEERADLPPPSPAQGEKAEDYDATLDPNSDEMWSA